MVESTAQDQDAQKISVTVEGLLHKNDFDDENPNLFSVTLNLGGDNNIASIWTELKSTDIAVRLKVRLRLIDYVQALDIYRHFRSITAPTVQMDSNGDRVR